ncbi:MAG TPA: HAMP domain-containing sensor histidine kinase [Polyangia bacterium]|nr:HAMP domain-containing sensor histidine kinase [Polyangia bacterium]
MLVVLVLCFAVAPGALLLTVGVLVLVFGHQVHDIVFGILILSLAATLIAGITATVVYVRRGTSLAKLQAEFVQKVSHDLRTPLTSIKMFVETLQEGRLTDKDKVDECLDVLSRETDRLTGMVERLLEWARMEAGKRVYETERVTVDRVVDGAMQGLESQVKLSGLESVTHVHREIADHLPLVDVDPEAMADALLNVMSNALRYTPADKKEITVRAVKRDKDVVISISDNGPGIPHHEQSRIFEKFYRVVDPALPDVEGTGLGLAMVHHIVRAHRGRITVQSDLGKGAAFHIFLPAANEAA